jgi:hypothetical protein
MLKTPLQMVVLVVAGWVNEQHPAVNAYLRKKNRVLRELHGRRRLRFTDDQRRRLAAKGELPGRQGLGNRLIHGVPKSSSGVVLRRERLGGIRSHYYRYAA